MTLILSEDRDVKTRYYYPIPQYFTYCTLFFAYSIVFLMLFLIVFLIISGFYAPLFLVGLGLRDFFNFLQGPCFFQLFQKVPKMKIKTNGVHKS